MNNATYKLPTADNLITFRHNDKKNADNKTNDWTYHNDNWTKRPEEYTYEINSFALYNGVLT